MVKRLNNIDSLLGSFFDDFVVGKIRQELSLGLKGIVNLVIVLVRSECEICVMIECVFVLKLDFD